MNKKSFLILSICTLISFSVKAQTSKVLVPVKNSTAIPIAGKDASNEPVALSVDSNGNLFVTSGLSGSSQNNSFLVDFSTSLEAASVTKNSSGKLYKVTGRIDSTAATATYYLQIIDSSSVPPNGAVNFMMAPIKIAHNTGNDTYFDIDLLGSNGRSGIFANSGIVICLSNTGFTKTLSGNFLSMTALYE